MAYFGLYNLWYKNYPQTSFHFFNDIEEWNYMDKAGHIYSSYQVARKSHLFLEKKILTIPLRKSCFYSLFFMLGIEVLDGFSKNGGFQIMIYFQILLELEFFIFKKKNSKDNY